jgi:hypothetical protein
MTLLRTCVACGRPTDHEVTFTVPTFGKVTVPICDRSCSERVSIKTDPFAPGHVRLRVAPDPLFLTHEEEEQQDAADA